jgi:surface antigen
VIGGSAGVGVSPQLYRRWRTLREAGGAGLTLGAALLLAGCSISFPIGSLIEDDRTASIAPKKQASPLSPELGPEDWRRARAALATALDPQGNGAPVPWDNPETMMRGSFGAAGPAFVRNDQICRPFTATLVAQASRSALKGEACRAPTEGWQVVKVEPGEAKPDTPRPVKASRPKP